ncbi:MAG TPA: hypothetical protein VL976_10145 [Xanthobacteraceae bacterium]|nr:hypothetical protein [Xanthobacteraceae bacterium]
MIEIFYGRCGRLCAPMKHCNHSQQAKPAEQEEARYILDDGLMARIVGRQRRHGDAKEHANRAKSGNHRSGIEFESPGRRATFL